MRSEPRRSGAAPVHAPGASLVQGGGGGAARGGGRRGAKIDDAAPPVPRPPAAPSAGSGARPAPHRSEHPSGSNDEQDGRLSRPALPARCQRRGDGGWRLGRGGCPGQTKSARSAEEGRCHEGKSAGRPSGWPGKNVDETLRPRLLIVAVAVAVAVGCSREGRDGKPRPRTRVTARPESEKHPCHGGRSRNAIIRVLLLGSAKARSPLSIPSSEQDPLHYWYVRTNVRLIQVSTLSINIVNSLAKTPIFFSKSYVFLYINYPFKKGAYRGNISSKRIFRPLKAEP